MSSGYEAASLIFIKRGREMETCNNCFVSLEKKMRTCVNCNRVRYCSRKCQRKHWVAHKVMCTGSTNDQN